jgi:hypothetical protein
MKTFLVGVAVLVLIYLEIRYGIKLLRWWARRK